MASIAERRAAERQQKLDLMATQIEHGSLRIRKMTAEERKLNPPRPVSAGSKGARSRGR